jgi:hypothetical protein
MSAVAPFVGPALGLVSSGMQAYGAYQTGQSGYQSGMYQAMVAQQNAAIANQMGDRETYAGEVSSGMESMRGGARLGDTKAAQAANGLDVNSGSAVDVQASQRMMEKLNADTTMNNALLKAYGYRVQSQSDQAQAQLDVMGAGNARKAGRIKAWGDLLTGAASFGAGAGGGGQTDQASQLGNVLPTGDMTAADSASVIGGVPY